MSAFYFKLFIMDIYINSMVSSLIDSNIAAVWLTKFSDFQSRLCVGLCHFCEAV